MCAPKLPGCCFNILIHVPKLPGFCLDTIMRVPKLLGFCVHIPLCISKSPDLAWILHFELLRFALMPPDTKFAWILYGYSIVYA